MEFPELLSPPSCPSQAEMAAESCMNNSITATEDVHGRCRAQDGPEAPTVGATAEDALPPAPPSPPAVAPPSPSTSSRSDDASACDCDAEDGIGLCTPTVHVSLSGFLRGKLSDADDSPSHSPSTCTSAYSTSQCEEEAAATAVLTLSSASASGCDSGGAGSSYNGSSSGGGGSDWSSLPLRALAHAKAARELLNRDVREEKRRMKAAAQRDSDIAKDAAIWRRDVLPHWEEVCKSKLVRKLCLRGIPPAVRGQAWVALLGNAHNITAELYDIYLAQAAQALSVCDASVSSAAMTSASSSLVFGRERSLALIDVDLPRTFASLSFFAPEGPLHDPLRRVLRAYVCLRPDVGYVQGMSYLAATLLLFIPTELHAFQALAALLARHICFDLYRLDRALLNSHIRVFDELFSHTLPDLFAHFNALGVNSDLFLVEWLLTLFTRVLPLDVAARVWDAFLVLDEENARTLCVFLIQTALGLLSYLRVSLLGADFGECLQLTKQLPPDVDATALFAAITSIDVPQRQYRQMLAAAKATGTASPPQPQQRKQPPKDLATLSSKFMSLMGMKR